MKQLFKKTFISSFIILLLFYAYQITSKIDHKNEINQNIKTIPKFSYKNTKGGIFTNQNLKDRTNTIFIYFNTECEYCNEEAQMIKENIDDFYESQLIFISLEKPELIKKFAQNHQLITYDNIHFLCDDKVTFASTFDVSTLPCLILYDKNKKLIEKIKGQTKVTTLLKKMNQE
ncbi:peroxiredoxin family protein [Flavobacterium sp.]|uniref:peroxiredoxin family protein n=1 Tax=Flavobacterium sp. TaxID=239 RepID=UPI003D0AC9D3